jgi:hypothetical protein
MTAYIQNGYNHSAPQIRSRLPFLSSVRIQILLQIGQDISCHILSNPHSTVIWSRQHHLTSVPIHISCQIRSRHHPLSSVLIHILIQIGRESFLYLAFQSTYHLKIGHDSIIYHLFLYTYHLNLGQTSFSIICTNPHITSNWPRNLPVTKYPVHITLFFFITALSHICSISESTAN